MAHMEFRLGGSQDDPCMAPNKRPGNLFMTPVYPQDLCGYPISETPWERGQSCK